ncbi:hypothetical protein ACLB2K_012897 [Fragaria x ananassa]
MVGPQPTQDTGSVPSMERISQMLEQLISQNLATQKSITDLVEQIKTNRALWEANHEKLTVLSEDSGHLEGNKDMFEGSLQRTQQESGQATNFLNMTHAIVDQRLAKKIELHGSQSNGEDFPLDGPMSKEEATLSINDKELEVEAGEIMDNNSLSKFRSVPQKDELEGRTKQSILEEAVGSSANGEPQIHRRFDQANNLPVRDEYVDTGQTRGGQTCVLKRPHQEDDLIGQGKPEYAQFVLYEGVFGFIKEGGSQEATGYDQFDLVAGDRPAGKDQQG